MPRTCRHDHGWLQPIHTARRGGTRRGFLLVLALVGSVFLAACSSSGSEGGGPVQVEIISLDHAPIRPVTEEASDLATEYGEDVTLSTYHFDTPDGDSFAAGNRITDHTPIAIFVNGESEFDVDGRAVQFLSFPQGEGTGVVADGDWTIADLRAVLDRAVLDVESG